MKDFIESIERGENITGAYRSPERIAERKAKRKYIWVHGVLFAAGNSLGMSGFLGVYSLLVTT